MILIIGAMAAIGLAMLQVVGAAPFEKCYMIPVYPYDTVCWWTRWHLTQEAGVILLLSLLVAVILVMFSVLTFDGEVC